MVVFTCCVMIKNMLWYKNIFIELTLLSLAYNLYTYVHIKVYENQEFATVGMEQCSEHTRKPSRQQ